MKQRKHPRWSPPLYIGLLMVVLTLTGIHPGDIRAGFPFEPRCPGEMLVEAVMDESLEGFARAEVRDESPEHFMIRVNPYRYSYGRDMMQWLFYRQCAHIELGHALHMIGTPEANVPEEIQADCWATRAITSMSKLGYRILQNIDRDLKRMRIWDPSLGPPRAIDLFGCQHKEMIQAPQRLKIN